jgi:hypothetical protein
MGNTVVGEPPPALLALQHVAEAMNGALFKIVPEILMERDAAYRNSSLTLVHTDSLALLAMIGKGGPQGGDGGRAILQKREVSRYGSNPMHKNVVEDLPSPFPLWLIARCTTVPHDEGIKGL